MHIIESFAAHVTLIDKLLEELHLTLAVTNLQPPDPGERKLNGTSGRHASIQHGEHVSHTRLDLIARELGLECDGCVVERMYGYATGYGVFRAHEAVQLSELLRDGKHGSLNEHVAVLTADVEFFLHETKRPKVRYAHAFRLTHVTIDVGRYFVPYLNDIFK